MEKIRIIELPKCKMVSSGCDTVSDFAPGGILDRFDKWFSEVDAQRKDKFYPRDFLWFNEQEGGFVWYYAVEDLSVDTDGFEIVDFEGGLYAVATSIDGDEENSSRVYHGIRDWVINSEHFEIDEERSSLGHIITPPTAIKVMGYGQMENYIPIKVK
ncbi:Bacterial transcription activator, effector binding domain [compost metagenome]